VFLEELDPGSSRRLAPLAGARSGYETGATSRMRGDVTYEENVIYENEHATVSKKEICKKRNSLKHVIYGDKRHL
jgi:hypothetical protein